MPNSVHVFRLMSFANQTSERSCTDATLRKQEKRCFFVLALFLVGAALLHAVAPPPFSQRRMRDFEKLSAALTVYKHDHGTYPVASFVSAYSNGSHRADWIEGLSPGYLAKVPEDPRGSTDATRQYMYVSDGRDYKIIAHGPEDMDEVARNFPKLVDPRRPTWAYGVWTTGAAAW